jgi:hypothetical protein
MRDKKQSLMVRIALFPVKLILRVLEVAIILIVAVAITLGIFCGSRTSEPMVMREAQGMTYGAFLEDREDAIDPDGFVQKFEKITFPVIKSALVSVPATLKTLLPSSRLMNEFYRIPYFSYIAGNEKGEWADLPKLYWKAFERANWAFLVNMNSSVRHPVVPGTPEEGDSTNPDLAPDSGSTL